MINKPTPEQQSEITRLRAELRALDRVAWYHEVEDSITSLPRDEIASLKEEISLARTRHVRDEP